MQKDEGLQSSGTCRARLQLDLCSHSTGSIGWCRMVNIYVWWYVYSFSRGSCRMLGFIDDENDRMGVGSGKRY